MRRPSSPPRLEAKFLLALGLVATGQDESPDLELLSWSRACAPESAFPSWLVGDGPARLVVTRIEGDRSATLLLHSLEGADSAPRQLAAGAGWFLNWADFPAVASLAGGTLAWSWLASDPAHNHSYGTRFQVGGTDLACSAARPLEEHVGPGEHGFVSLAPLGTGTSAGFLALWLDGRAGLGHEAETRLYARMLGRGGELGAEMLVDGRTCSCCPTSLARLANGTHLAAWRDRSDGEVRDISLARYDEKSARWSEPELLHADGWEIDGCPVNGPRIAVSPTSTAVTWYTGAKGGRALASFGDANGRGFDRPVRIDEGAALGRGDALFLADGSLLVGWMEHGHDQSSWCLRRVRPKTGAGPVLVVAEVSGERASGFLRLAADGHDALVAYTETTPERHVVVRRVRPLP